MVCEIKLKIEPFRCSSEISMKLCIKIDFVPKLTSVKYTIQAKSHASILHKIFYYFPITFAIKILILAQSDFQSQSRYIGCRL